MARSSSTARFRHISHDLAIVALSVVVAVMLVQSHTIDSLLDASQEFGHIGSFFAGMFFTSIFTTAPAIATLGEISLRMGIVETALWAALGSVIGDMLIFRFVKDRIADDLLEILPHKRGARRFAKLLKFRFFRYLTFFAGGLIIASPLPDELGVGLLGLSKMREVYFVPLSFVFNFIGIFTIGLIAVSRV
jgi:uncharacterized membrane protein YdjX (TVP38/TMEM64 family)